MALPFVRIYTGVPEQALGWFPLGLGLAVEDEPSELSCMCLFRLTQYHTVSG